MRITKIEINSFGDRLTTHPDGWNYSNDVKLDDLSESFNLIIGENGSGKASFLERLSSSLGMDHRSWSYGENEMISQEGLDSRIEFAPGKDKNNRVLVHVKSKYGRRYFYGKDDFGASIGRKAAERFFARNQDSGLRFDSELNEFVIFSDTAEPILLTELGNGISSLLSIVADIAIKIDEANPELGDEALELTSGIVLIDDLDLFLDPKQQSEVIEGLMRAFPNVQFFATTNSPIVIQSLHKGKLIKVTRNDIKYVATDAFRGQSVEDILEDVMDLPMPSRSKRYQRMVKASEEYYDLLERELDTTKAKELLDELSLAFGDNPAYYGYLEYRAKVKKSEQAILDKVIEQIKDDTAADVANYLKDRKVALNLDDKTLDPILLKLQEKTEQSIVEASRKLFDKTKITKKSIEELIACES
jgi:predicted ATP-dependent endonuclease of OLD family